MILCDKKCISKGTNAAACTPFIVPLGGDSDDTNDGTLARVLSDSLDVYTNSTDSWLCAFSSVGCVCHDDGVIHVLGG